MTEITREQIEAYKTWIAGGKQTIVQELKHLSTIEDLDAFTIAVCDLAIQALNARDERQPHEEPKHV